MFPVKPVPGCHGVSLMLSSKEDTNYNFNEPIALINDRAKISYGADEKV